MLSDEPNRMSFMYFRFLFALAHTQTFVQILTKDQGWFLLETFAEKSGPPNSKLKETICNTHLAAVV